MPTAANNYYHGIGMIDNFDLDRLAADDDPAGGNAYIGELLGSSKGLIDRAAMRRLDELRQSVIRDLEDAEIQTQLQGQQIEQQHRDAISAILATPGISQGRISEQIQQAQSRFLQRKASARLQDQSSRKTRFQQQKRLELDELGNAASAKFDFDTQFEKRQLPWQRAKMDLDRQKVQARAKADATEQKGLAARSAPRPPPRDPEPDVPDTSFADQLARDFIRRENSRPAARDPFEQPDTPYIRNTMRNIARRGEPAPATGYSPAR